MSFFPSKWTYLFPDGEYRILCNKTYIELNPNEDGNVYFIVDDIEWELLFPHHPKLMVDYVCKQTDFPNVQTFTVEIQIDFTPQFYTRKIQATSPEAAERIAMDTALEPHEQDDIIASVEVAEWQVEGIEGEEE